MFSLFNLIQHFANGLEALASVFKDMLMLRTFFIIGMSMELIYDFNIAEKPLLTNIIWTIVIVLINLFQVFILLNERGTLIFNHDELILYQKVFSKMHKVNFKKLVRIGHWKVIEKNTVLVVEDTSIDNVLLIFDGIVEVRVKNKLVAILKEGQFIGEMSFLSGSQTTATVTSLTELKYISWPVDKLNEIINKVPEIKFGLNNIFNSDLINKIVIRNTE